MPMSKPELIPPDRLVHADWGSDSKKRWMCVASRQGGGYIIRPPEPVGDLRTFWARVAQRSNGGSVLVGYDFPIGLPVAYAEQAGITHFKDSLLEFGHGPWSDFYRPAERQDEVSIRRPFYPFRPGGTKQCHLVDGLGVESMRSLLRRCEHPTETRGAASPLFWTLGGKQVGRAAIIGWRDLLGPGIAGQSLDLRVWPFDGSLAELIAPGALVVAETYPAEACVHLGLTPPGRGWSKTSQSGREAQAGKLLDWAMMREVEVDDQLSRMIRDGFGEQKAAEDPFDAMLGIMSMIEVALGYRNEGAPRDNEVRQVEGWILGQEAPDAGVGGPGRQRHLGR